MSVYMALYSINAPKGEHTLSLQLLIYTLRKERNIYIYTENTEAYVRRFHCKSTTSHKPLAAHPPITHVRGCASWFAIAMVYRVWNQERLLIPP